MKLISLEIKNFRGICQTHIFFPQETRIICLIGAGDSCKSTILKAIEWVLWPSWSLTSTDTDFYNCDVSSEIEIIATIAEIPQSLLKEDKFGLYLRDSDKLMSMDTSAVIEGEDDEPESSDSAVLTIKLTIDSSLEPKWTVITNRSEPKPISHRDRAMLSFGAVGYDHEKDFRWGRTSVLQKYSDSKDTLHDAFTEAMRNAVANTSLESLDDIADTMTAVGAQYGVSFNGEIHNRILMQNGSYSTTVGVFDDKVPFSQRGLGSKRLLSIGMNVNAFDNGTLVLVDEIETGLEPYRISALINAFRKQFEDSGQLIMTTHSRSVVCECGVDELCVVASRGGDTYLYPLNSIEDIKTDVQGLIRGEPDAFLCKRIIVCEGKTEIGLLRAFDEYLAREYSCRMAYYGVGAALGGGGNKFFKLAKLLYSCGYDVCILMDSDVAAEEEEKDLMEKKGIKVFSWEEGNAIEEQIFNDASLESIELLLAIAVENKDFGSIKSRLVNEIDDIENLLSFEHDQIRIREDFEAEEEIYKCIGTVAKGKRKKGVLEGGWYKRIDLGQEVGDVLFASEDAVEDGAYFTEVMTSLREWIMKT